MKFRKRLFVGTVPKKKKKKTGEKVSILEKLRKRLFVGTVPPKKKYFGLELKKKWAGIKYFGLELIFFF